MDRQDRKRRLDWRIWLANLANAGHEKGRLNALSSVILMVATVFYGVFELKRMQADYDARRPAKLGKHHSDEGGAVPAA